MTCEAVGELLHAYLDGELAAEQTRQVERHLADCPRCAHSLAEFEALGTALRKMVPGFAPPPGLRDGVRAALRRAGRPSGGISPGWNRPPLILLAGLLGLLAGAILLTWYLVTPSPCATPATGLLAEVVANHDKALRENHLVEVETADPAALQRALAAPLGFAPVVLPAGPGTEQVGGRATFLDRHSAAAVVYRRDKHVIGVFTSPTPAGRPAFPLFLDKVGKYFVARWGADGNAFWVVSDLDRTEMMQFLQSLGKSAPPGCRAMTCHNQAAPSAS